ncbi:MAG: hypothetical protein HY293_13200 [Planctomycetes bacterium]|nr:hypothetical protein [Planctomycetota bacterium]
MMFWLALIAPLLMAAPQDDLRQEVEKLKKQNLELQERLSLLEQSALENAQTIQRLRQVVKLLEAQGPSAEPAGPKTPGGPAPKPEIGPDKVIRAKLVYVDAKENFVALSVGKKDKVEVGYKFQIMRETYENGGENRLVPLGVGQVEKFLGQDTHAKLNIIEGKVSDMKVDDLAVAIRRISDTSPVKEDGKATPKPEVPEPPKDGVFTITGKMGAGGHVLNYGSVMGAHQTQLLYVYKDGKFKAKLRLDKVEKQHSVGYVVDGTMELPPEQGDQVYVKELNKVFAGKVALSDEKRGVLAVDLRQRDGVKPGMHCEVRRLGQKIGSVLITEVQNWGSWAKPEGDLRIDQIQKGDFVEVIEEK